MSAAKMVLMGVIGAGAGAFLALSTIPSFAPYRERASDSHQGELGDGRAYAQAHAARTQGYGQPDAGQSHQDFAVRLGAEHGTLVLDLPDWAGDTVAWMGFGRRVWDDWRAVTEGFDEVPHALFRNDRRPSLPEDAPGYALLEREDAPVGPGYVEGSAPDWNPSYAQPERAGPRAERAGPQADLAELAARRAAEAAQDVMAAEEQ